LVLVAVEKRGHVSGRVRMSVIPDFKAATIIPFLTQNVAPGSTIYTDGLKSFAGLVEAGFKHVARIQPLRSELRKGAKSAVPLADRAIGNLQQWLIGTYHGVSKAQLQVYLDEFVFRHNRRKTPAAGRFGLLSGNRRRARDRRARAWAECGRSSRRRSILRCRSIRFLFMPASMSVWDIPATTGRKDICFARPATNTWATCGRIMQNRFPSH